MFEGGDRPGSADALLVSDEHGLVAFDLSAPSPYSGEIVDWIDEIQTRQDEIFRNIQVKLLRNRALVYQRRLVIDPEIVTVLPELPDCVRCGDIRVATPETLARVLGEFHPLPVEHKPALNATIQRITTIKPKMKRNNVLTNTSHGFVLKEIEKNIANLDSWQKLSAIAYPEGPQRIRGLAGSGKTIVLALKAAYLHAKNPEWNIVVTYYSRALHQQFRDLIRRFMFETKQDEPDWTKIRILHSWGGKGGPGMYSEIAERCGMEPVSWKEASNRYGNHAFDRICIDVLEKLNDTDSIKPVYDAVLVDEAQDLPRSFFEMVYAATSPPKRIVWAYDELQNLGHYAMSTPNDLFGKNKYGQPRVTLKNEADRPPQDIILKVCYRNTPWALAVAHSLGFGIYRDISDKNETPIVQMFDDPNLWQEIGYEKIRGKLASGENVSLRRHPDCTPEYYSDQGRRLIDPDDSVRFENFDNSSQQAMWIADQIKIDLEINELLHQDILIILPNAQTAKSEYGSIAEALNGRDIFSHLVGASSSRDQVFQENSIAVTHIYRAKGNEAPMVYFVNSHECFDGFQLAKKRNILFTGMTRSKAWVRVCGVGTKSEGLCDEYRRVVDANYHLNFDYPTERQLGHIRRIHRDRPEYEQRQIGVKIQEASELLKLIRRGEISLDVLPDDLIADFRGVLAER